MSAVRAPVAIVSVETALEVADTYPIFPCDLAKRPLTANGFKAATKDHGAIKRWWNQHPDALIGLPTGERTRLVVIDYDPDKANADTREWVEQWASLLAGTFGTETPRGGKHWYFQAADAYASGANIWLDGKKRAGLDVRANGGYVIYWPAHGLALFDNPIAILPPTLIADRKRVIPKDRAIPKRQRELLVRARSWAQERDRVVKALAFVDPADRDNWLRIGLAIHAACSGHDDGFAVWHAWSAGGLTGDVPASYCSEHDCRYHWQSFNLDTASKRDLVTLGTLFKLAQDGGYESRPVPPLPPDLEPGYQPNITPMPTSPSGEKPTMSRNRTNRTPPDMHRTSGYFDHWLRSSPNSAKSNGCPAYTRYSSGAYWPSSLDGVAHSNHSLRFIGRYQPPRRAQRSPSCQARAAAWGSVSRLGSSRIALNSMSPAFLLWRSNIHSI